MPFKNLILQQLVRILRPFVPLHVPQGQRRFLIIATTALGDTLWAGPAITSLRQSFPDAFIGVAVSPIGWEILMHHPSIDRCYLATHPLLPRIIKLYKTLYKERFDTILLFHASQRLIFPLCSLLGAQRIIGTRGINKGFDACLSEPLEDFQEHEIARRLRIIERAGGKTHTETLSFFFSPEETIQFYPNNPKSLGYKKQIVLHPGSKDLFKRWPLKHFITLGRALQNEVDCELWITGTTEEEELIRAFLQAIPEAKRAGPFRGVRPFAAFLKKTDLLISNDTGPFHLACALNVPALGLYAPTDSLRCGPYQAKRAIALQKPQTCSPCIKRKCAAPFCLLQIDPCEILASALQLLT